MLKVLRMKTYFIRYGEKLKRDSLCPPTVYFVRKKAELDHTGYTILDLMLYLLTRRLLCIVQLEA